MGLNFPIHPSVALVSADAVKAAFYCQKEDVVRMVEDGRLRWVWDFNACGRSHTDRRFLVWELAGCDLAQATLAEVVDLILHDLPVGRIRSKDLVLRFLLTRTHMHALVRGGHLVGHVEQHTLWIDRASLEAFLTRRLVMSAPSSTNLT